MSTKRHHPAADLFPPMSEQQYAQLRADIEANGLREAVWLDPDGAILDGRHRVRACDELSRPYATRTYKKADVLAFVCAQNLHRRHLTSSQRAIVALDLLPMLEQEAAMRRKATTFASKNSTVPQIVAEPGEARDHAAILTGTNRQYVSDAKTIAAEAPELIEQIRSGDLTIPQAQREMRSRRFATITPRKEEGAASVRVSSVGADSELLLEAEHEAMEMRMAERLETIDAGLSGCTEKQQRVWRSVTGIREDGAQGEKWTIRQVADHTGVSKESIRAHYIEADRQVLISMVRSLLRGLRPSPRQSAKRTERTSATRS